MTYRKTAGPTIDDLKNKISYLEKELKHSEGRTEFYKDQSEKKLKGDNVFCIGVFIAFTFLSLVALWASSLPRENSAKLYRDSKAKSAGVDCPLLPGDCSIVFESGEVWKLDCSSTDVCLRVKK